MITDRVLFELERRGMTVTELADRAGLTRSAVSRWLNGHTAMKTDNLERVLEVLGMVVERRRKRRR